MTRSFPHGCYPEPVTWKLCSPTFKWSISQSMSHSLSTSVSARDGPDNKICKSKLSPANKWNIEMASNLIIFNAIMTGKWDDIESSYLTQAVAQTDHGPFHTCFPLQQWLTSFNYPSNSLEWRDTKSPSANGLINMFDFLQLYFIRSGGFWAKKCYSNWKLRWEVYFSHVYSITVSRWLRACQV